MVVTIVTLDFKWVEFHSGYGLLFNVSSFHAYTYYRTRDKGSLTMLGGVGVTMIASLVFMNKISFHTWFNYLDISHTILAVAAFVMYLAATRLEVRDADR
jgi:hypothetical protein